MTPEQIAALEKFLELMMPDDGAGSFTIQFTRKGNEVTFQNLEGMFGRHYVALPPPWER